MFATLDTSSKRLRFPRDREVIITDTVGFIRDLPENLKGAFKSTLEELNDSDMLIHVVDISSENYERQIDSVNKVLEELSLTDKIKILVFNKIDLVSSEKILEVESKYPDALFISALKRDTFFDLLENIQLKLFQEGKSVPITF
jgi:GTP-binding protein HflX